MFPTTQFICKIAGLNISVEDNNLSLLSVERNQTLCIANHISYLDLIIIGALIPTNFVSKHEAGHRPLVGRVGQIMNHIFVRRENLQHQVSCLFQIKNRLQKENICLFPEGTTTRDRTPAREYWKAGHLWACTPKTSQILCVGIAFEEQDKLAWVDDQAFLPHLWARCTQC